MSDNEIKSRLVFETDTASLNKAKKAYRDLGDDLDEFIQMQEKSAKKQRELAKQRAEDIEFERNARSGSFDSPRSGANAGGGAGGQGFGKLEAGINALSSLSNGIDVGSIVGAADGILDFSEGVKSLPNAFSGVLSLINPLTVGLAAVAGAIAFLSAQSAENAKMLRARLDANRDASELIASGATTADIQEQIRAKKRLLEAEQGLLEQNKKAYEVYENLNPIQGIFAKALDQSEEELSSDINKSAETIRGYQEDIRALEGSMDDARVAANDYAQSILQQSELVKQAVLTEFEANERTAEQNRERIRQLENQIQATEAQLEVLKNSEVQSAETTAKIAELEAQLKALGQEADITSRFTEQTAKDIQNASKEQADAEKKAADERTRTIEESARKQQEAVEQSAQALQNLNTRLVDLAIANADKEEDASRQLNDSLSDARRKLTDDLQDLDEKARQDRQKFIIDSQGEEAKLARDHARNLEKIQKDANRQREDLARNLDFAGLFDLENDVNDQLSEAQAQYDAERQERQTAYDEQLRDLQTQAGKERRERQKAYNDQLSEIRLQANRAQRDRQIAYQRELEAAQRQYDRQLKQIEENLARQTSAYERAGRNGANAGSPSNGRTGVGNAPSPVIGNPPTSGGGIGRNVSATTNNNNSIAFTINGAQNPQNVAAEVRNEIRKVFRIR